MLPWGLEPTLLGRLLLRGIPDRDALLNREFFIFSNSCVSNMAISSSEAKWTLLGVRGLISGSSSET